jgi:hypothetical protein
LILSGSLVVQGKAEKSDEYQKGSFLTQHFAQGRRVAVVGMVSTVL